MKKGPGNFRQAPPIVLVISGNDPSGGTGQCADIGLLGQARDLDLPIVAIGGIDAANGARLIEAGANMLAVISAVFAVTDSFKAASDLSILFERSPAAAGQLDYSMETA